MLLLCKQCNKSNKVKNANFMSPIVVVQLSAYLSKEIVSILFGVDYDLSTTTICEINCVFLLLLSLFSGCECVKTGQKTASNGCIPFFCECEIDLKISLNIVKSLTSQPTQQLPT